jgi:cytochrome c oxidase cbb3-type subunit I/II
MRNAKLIALIAGFAFISLALVIQGLLPAAMKETRVVKVTKTIRTNLGELKDVAGETEDYDALLRRGRQIYIREGCWYCHSMYVRPVAGEQRRWGPVSQVGEYAYDVPHTFGTRRIGPDLTRDGGKYGDDWHRAHFFDARMVVPDSIMPKFTWLFEKYQEKEKEGEAAEESQGLPKERNAQGLREQLGVRSDFVPNADGKALIAFVQNLGMNRGKWRDTFPYQIISSGSAPMKSDESVEHGKKAYKRRCEGCHGEKGDGKGPAAKFFVRAKPRDFTSGTYKFRTTPSGSVPLDSDLYRTVTEGVRGTAMPPWFTLPEEERWDLVQYIKTFSKDFEEFPPEPPIFVPEAPKPDEALLAKGKDLYDKLRCRECHGDGGMGDGPSAPYLTDDFGDKILPTDFTKGIFKSGPRPEDIYRTFMTGLNGTPMPSYGPVLASEEDRWALSYFVLSFSSDEGKWAEK